jgi:hypothetical protein
MSASSLSLLRQLLDQILPLASSPIDVLFPSFGVYGIIVVAFDLLAAPIPESRSMDISHSHVGFICAYDGVNGVNTRFFRQLQLLLRLILLFLCSPIPALSRRLVPRFTSLYIRYLSRIVVLTQYALVIPSGSHKTTA